jgi:hypothetical protein
MSLYLSLSLHLSLAPRLLQYPLALKPWAHLAANPLFRHSIDEALLVLFDEALLLRR